MTLLSATVGEGGKYADLTYEVHCTPDVEARVRPIVDALRPGIGFAQRSDGEG